MLCFLFLPNPTQFLLSLAQHLSYFALTIFTSIRSFPTEDFHVKYLIPPASDELLALHLFMEDTFVVLPQHMFFQPDDKGEEGLGYDIARNESCQQDPVVYLDEL